MPLDWLDPSDDLRATIAIIRYKAIDRGNYKGPVFINPGEFFSLNCQGLSADMKQEDLADRESGS